MSITKTIQAIGKDIGTINKAINAIDAKIKQVSDELSSQYVTQSAFDALTAQINALTERVEKLEQGTQAEPQAEPSAEPSAEPPSAPSEPPKKLPPNAAKLYRNRLTSETDDAQVIRDITAWFDTLPKDDAEVSIGDTIITNKAGKYYIYFDGFRITRNGNGQLYLFNDGDAYDSDTYSGNRLGAQNYDGESYYDVSNYTYQRWADTTAHITIVRQDDDGIYGVYNAMSEYYRTEIFHQGIW